MKENYIIINCPHCNDYILIYNKELNCRIFRHGVFKDTLQQIKPHLQKEECETLKNKDLIIGCGKPFKIIKNNEYKAIICDYI